MFLSRPIVSMPSKYFHGAVEVYGGTIQDGLPLRKHTVCFYQIWMSHRSATCKALFDCDYKLDCWPDCSQIVARLFTICLCDLMSLPN
jgi:hypothetical protein